MIRGSVIALAVLLMLLPAGCDQADGGDSQGESLSKLPAPDTTGGMTLAAALNQRRSIRSFASTPLTSTQVGQLLWAGQGITDGSNRKTAPSAGALYPLTLLHADASGIYRYDPAGHAQTLVRSGDHRSVLAAAALGQDSVEQAPSVIAIAGRESITAVKYGSRAERYMKLEAGHAAQNVLLQATALGLGAVPVGAFDDADVGEVLGLSGGETSLYLIPVGVPR